MSYIQARPTVKYSTKYFIHKQMIRWITIHNHLPVYNLKFLFIKKHFEQTFKRKAKNRKLFAKIYRIYVSFYDHLNLRLVKIASSKKNNLRKCVNRLISLCQHTLVGKFCPILQPRLGLWWSTIRPKSQNEQWPPPGQNYNN